MPSSRYLRLVDFGLWVAAASAAVVVPSVVLGLLVGGDLAAAKALLFVVGVLLFGLGSLLIQPARPRGVDTVSASADPGRVEVLGLTPRAGDGFGGRHRDGRLATLRTALGPSTTHEHRFEARLHTVGPLARHPLPFAQRVGRGYKVFATSLVVLAVSYAMELAGVPG